MLMRVFSAFNAVLRVLIIVGFTALILSVLLQVTARMMLPRSPIWTEEFARFALIMVAGLGAGWALRTGDLVNVDLVTSVLPQPLKSIVEALTMFGIIVFCIIQVPPALEFVDIGQLQTSPALGWNMFYMHLAVLFAPLTLGLAAFERLLRLATALRS